MLDIPGQMLKLTQIMTKIGASFSQIVQTKNDNPTDNQTARVVIITHDMSKTQLAELKDALEQKDTINLLAAYKVLS
jgi:homoserine dehydrogenase